MRLDWVWVPYVRADLPGFKLVLLLKPKRAREKKAKKDTSKKKNSHKSAILMLSKCCLLLAARITNRQKVFREQQSVNSQSLTRTDLCWPKGGPFSVCDLTFDFEEQQRGSSWLHFRLALWNKSLRQLISLHFFNFNSRICRDQARLLLLLWENLFHENRRWGWD